VKIAKIGGNCQKYVKIAAKLVKIADNWGKSPKICVKRGKIGENRRKLVCKNRQKLVKIAENEDRSIDPIPFL
jgi:hypothetical protein